MTNNKHIDTLEIYVDIVEKESSKRKKELAHLKDMLGRIDDNNYKIIFMKITVPELYAQYEGFFKSIFSQTIKYVRELEIDNRDINRKYIILPLLTYIAPGVTNQRTKAEKMIDVFDNAFNNNKGFLNIFNIEEYILNLDSTKHTMDILGINNYKMPMQNLDLLYNRRCEIAHGNISESNPFYISPDLDITDYIVKQTYQYWDQHYKSVLYAMNTMSELFIDYISSEGYISA